MPDLFGLEQQTPRRNDCCEDAALAEVLKALNTHPALAWCERMNRYVVFASQTDASLQTGLVIKSRLRQGYVKGFATSTHTDAREEFLESITRKVLDWLPK